MVSGCQQFFDELKKERIPFTIASASIKPNIDFFVESFELEKWFEPKKIVYDDGSFENKVKMFQYAAEIIGVPIEKCLIFEDSESGIRDAYIAGCENIIVVDSMGVAKKHLGKPGVKKIIKSFEEL